MCKEPWLWGTELRSEAGLRGLSFTSVTPIMDVVASLRLAVAT